MGADVDPQAIVDKWLSGKKPHSVRSYVRSANKFAEFCFPNRPSPSAADVIEVIRTLGKNGGLPHLMNKWALGLLDSGSKMSSVSHYQTAIRALVKVCRDHGLTDERFERTRLVVAVNNNERTRTAVPRRDLELLFAHVDKLAQEGQGRKGRQAVRDSAILRLMAIEKMERSVIESMTYDDFLHAECAVLVKEKRGSLRKRKHRLRPITHVLIEAWLKVRGRHQGPLFHRTNPSLDRRIGKLTGDAIRRLLASYSRQIGLSYALVPDMLRVWSDVEVAQMAAEGYVDL